MTIGTEGWLDPETWHCDEVLLDGEDVTMQCLNVNVRDGIVLMLANDPDGHHFVGPDKTLAHEYRFGLVEVRGLRLRQNKYGAYGNGITKRTSPELCWWAKEATDA